MIVVTDVRFPAVLLLPIGAAILSACAARPAGEEGVAGAAGTAASLENGQPLASTAGFSGPEAVRYDPEQDVYFVSNFNGRGMAADNNGFISRLLPDGKIEQLQFIAGGANGITLHAPRGMAIVGDTLWAADVDAVRGFHRRSGAAVAIVDFTGRDVGFLNDIAVGPDGALYVTDTGKNRIYRISAGAISVVLTDTSLGAPNGIAWDGTNRHFIVVPYGGGHAIRSWRPENLSLQEIGTSPGAEFDGVEVLSNGRVLVASQKDSSLHLFAGGRGRPIIRTAGEPADIGVDTKRNRVAVPYIALNRVDIWQLPRD